MTEKFYARPVIPLLTAFMTGITAERWFPGFFWAASVAVAASIVGICICMIQKRAASVLPITLLFALGYLALHPWMAPKFPTHHVVHFLDSNHRRIVGTVDGSPITSANRSRLTLNIETIDEGKALTRVSGKIALSVWGVQPGLAAGDRIAYVGKIRMVRNFNNPGQYDYKNDMNFKKIWGVSHVQADKLEILLKNSAGQRFIDIDGLRNRISKLIDKTADGDHRGVLKALIIGERNHVSEDIRTAFNRAGVGHLLAISGLHVGIVATSAFVFFQWLFSFIKPFLWNAWTRKGAALMAMWPVIIYGLLAGMSPSTQRAVIMVAVFLASFLFERDQDLMNSLAVAALIVLVIYPPALFSISFQLSFTAVFFIIYGFSSLQTEPVKPVLLEKLLNFLRVSLLAILGTVPLVMFYFNQLSLIGLLTNIVLIPMIGFLVVPIGLSAAFLYPFSSAGALWCLKMSTWILIPSLKVTAFFAAMPFAAVKTITPNYLEVACYYGLMLALFKLKRPAPPPPAGLSNGCSGFEGAKVPATGPRLEEVGGLFVKSIRKVWRECVSAQQMPRVVIVAVLVVACSDIGYWLYQRFWNADLRITVIDVGQGSAALLQLPKGDTLLIDGGGFSDNSGFNVGARIVAPLLWQKKIKTVETLILSHPNSDHLNGLLYIAEHFKVKRIWTNGQAAATKGFREFMEIVKKNKILMPEFGTIPRTHNINGVDLKIMYPFNGFAARAQKGKWRNYNSNSMVIQVQFGDKTLLFPGDITNPAEEELVSFHGAALKSDIMIAPHHGSRKSSSGRFLDAVSPEIVIVSAGWKNRFNFPHFQVLEKYRQRGYRLFRTDLDGAVTVTTDGKKLHVRPYLFPGGA